MPPAGSPSSAAGPVGSPRWNGVSSRGRQPEHGRGDGEEGFETPEDGHKSRQDRAETRSDRVQGEDRKGIGGGQVEDARGRTGR